MAAFLYFTAFVAQLAEFSGTEDDEYQYWIDAQVTAGVSIYCTKHFGLSCTHLGAAKLNRENIFALTFINYIK